MIASHDISDAVLAIRAARHPVVLGHVNPDADCLGSVLAMTLALRRMGQNAMAVVPKRTVGRRLRFMLDIFQEDVATIAANPAWKQAPIPLVDGDGEGVVDWTGVDLIIVADSALHRRVNLPKEVALPTGVLICNIDHHLGNEMYGDVNWVNPTSSSASQMVYQLLEALDAPSSPSQATLLYAGVHSDTCGFTLRGVGSESLGVAADLAKRRADISRVCQRLYRSVSPAEFQLTRLVYDKTQLDETGQVAWSVISYDELMATGCKPSDIDEQVLIPRSIEGVRIAILFSQPTREDVRLNIRSEDGISILSLAQSFGGGGHAQAAGAVIFGPIDEIVGTVIRRVKEYLTGVDAARETKIGV